MYKSYYNQNFISLKKCKINNHIVNDTQQPTLQKLTHGADNSTDACVQFLIALLHLETNTKTYMHIL